jgi:hypothetical protein
MKKELLFLLGAAALSIAFTSDGGNAQTSEKFFQLAVVNPIQIRGEDEAINILRLNLIYGKNTYVQGIDIGLVNHNTSGVSIGWQYGLVGFVEADFTGWHDNFVNIVRGEFNGFQSGFYNEMGSGKAFQWGFINRAEYVSGFQLAIVNYTENMYGLQIGLINIIRQKEELPVLPIVNWSF